MRNHNLRIFVQRKQWKRCSAMLSGRTDLYTQEHTVNKTSALPVFEAFNGNPPRVATACEKLTVIRCSVLSTPNAAMLHLIIPTEIVQRRETPVRNSRGPSQCRLQCNLHVLPSHLNDALHHLVKPPASSSCDKICSDVETLACCCQWTWRLFRRCGRISCAVGCRDSHWRC